MNRRPARPSLASPLKLIDVPLEQSTPDLALALYKFQGQALAGVPGDVAVYQPSTGVVELERDSKVAAAGEDSDIATGGVGGVEAGGVAVEGCLGDRGQYPEVVTVEVDWVGGAEKER